MTGTEEERLFTYRLDGHVATLTYNRPTLGNRINGAMREHINEAWARARDEQDCWVAILAANGPNFCLGADLTAPDGKYAAGKWPGTYWEVPTLNSFESGWEIFKPTIAAVNGPCVGYGLTAVANCDFVIASETATFSYPEVRVGIPTIVGAIRLPPKIGWSNAMELLLIGEPITAQRAHEMGLVWKVVSPDRLEAEAQALAARLVKSAPLAQRVVKEIGVRAATGQMGWTEAVRFGETMRRLHGFAAPDSQEGIRAFSEKRSPQWSGRSRL